MDSGESIGELIKSPLEDGKTNKDRLERVMDFILQMDSPNGLERDKLKYVFDLIEDELLEEYDKGLQWLERVDIERSCLNGLNNRRSEMEILAFILKVTRSGANKTKILYQANLSYSQLQNYLKFLKKSGFIREKKGRGRARIYTSTSKGDLYLYHWTKILHLFESVPSGDADLI